MLQRSYIFVFAAVGALLFAFFGNGGWGWTFLLSGIVPLLLSWKGQKSWLLGSGYILVFLLFFLYGFHVYQGENNLTGKENQFTGVVVSEPTMTNNMQWSFQVKLDAGGKIQVFANSQTAVPTYGGRCAFTGQLQRPETERNPYAFNYKDY
ncbi:MAG: DUF4131 domain-containing protein [Bacillus sp. (in: Bacteria)]|nr:DUF4131 domain-containing protein [Bacillus sp. (in: firmicutes)]